MTHRSNRSIHRFARIASLLPLAVVCAPAHAHAVPALSAFDTGLAVALLSSLALYANGARALWHAAPRRSTVRYTSLFISGWLLLALALLPPLAPISAETFAGHMLQHEVLMVAAAPLLVLGRPLAIWTWGMPPAWRAPVARGFQGAGFRAVWRFVTAPLPSTVLHAAALWIWHAPPLFAAAESNEAVHALQHAAFLFSALLFWNAVFQPRASAVGPSVLWLFVTMVHTGVLGVLLTFSTVVLYPSEAAALARWGLTALEDQQLGGLIMWVPGGAVYVVAAVALASRWFSETMPGSAPNRD